MSRWLTVVLSFAAMLAHADAVADKLAAAGVAEFTAAYQAWDGERFDAAAELFRRAVASAPESGTNRYWLGTTLFHRMLHLETSPAAGTNRPAVEATREAAVAALTQANRLQERDAETHALLGTLYGMKIGGNLARALRFGPRVQRHRQQALALGAENPRVRYLLGACLFHTAKKAPAQREALAAFLKAEELFDREAGTKAGPLEPRWGHSACLTFAGRAYEQLGERAKAAEYFRKALAAHPADRLAEEGLGRLSARQ